MIALASTITLDLARSWFDTPESLQRGIGLQILEAHATAADVGRIQNALLPSLWRDIPDSKECYMQWSMLEILARFPEAGPYPEVEIVFKEAGHAYTRVYAAQVLHATDSDRFARGLARECLWDCEEEARRIGCRTVSTERSDVQARLQEMAYDPHEEVGELAKNRIDEYKKKMRR